MPLAVRPGSSRGAKVVVHDFPVFVGLGKLLWAKKVPVAQYVVGPGH